MPVQQPGQIKENIKKIKAELHSDIGLVAATKTRTIDEIKEAIGAGITIIGENYVKEAEQKYNRFKGELKDRVKFHCIGHLQTNKIKSAIDIFDMIETVDSEKTAKEIDKRCRTLNRIMPILIEINSGEEENKTGIFPKNAVELIKNINKLTNIKIKGLMTMAPYFKNPEKTRPYFKRTKELFDKIKSLNIQNVDMEILSMGMSDSYKIAIQEGANLVRIGTKIFGRRD